MRGFRLDLLIGVAVLIEALLEVFLLVPGTPQLEVAIPALVAMATGIALRRRAPLTGLLILFTGGTVLETLDVYVSHLYFPFFTVFVSAYSLGAYARHRQFIAGLVLGTVLATAMTAVQPDNTASSYVFSVFVTMVGPAIVGRHLRHRARLHRTLRAKTEELARLRAEEAERAAGEERARIAGELDDVVAHALSAMTVQAAGARRLVLTDAARARDAFAAVEATGRDALDELRRLLGVLRHDDEELALAPQPSLRHAGSLVRRAGFPVELATEGDPRDLPAGLDLTAYRVLQEALAAAARRHAGHASVVVRYAPDAVELDVDDDGRGERELVGIAERVALYGGKLTMDPARVRARIPVTVA